jgi:sporulation-control protein
MKKRVLSSIGIGGATVDTVLPGVEFSPGETIEAAVDLSGGDTTQDISGIYFVLKAQGAGGGEYALSRFDVDEDVTLDAGEERSLPVEFRLPHWTPLTATGASVWLETGLDISWAVDPSDEDEIRVVPGDQTAALFEAVESLGFELDSSRLVEVGFLDDRPVAQKFDFRPTDVDESDLDDIEITLIPRERDLRILLEFGRVDEVAEEYDVAFDEDEVSITFEHGNPEMIANRLRREIDRHT